MYCLIVTHYLHLPVENASAEDPNILSSYSYDSTSGFYYDPKTGLYYDPKTQYHYNSQTGQYCYYDPTQLKYIPVDSEGLVCVGVWGWVGGFYPSRCVGCVNCICTG